MKKVLQGWLKTQQKIFYSDGIKKLAGRWTGLIMLNSRAKL